MGRRFCTHIGQIDCCVARGIHFTKSAEGLFQKKRSCRMQASSACNEKDGGGNVLERFQMQSVGARDRPEGLAFQEISPIEKGISAGNTGTADILLNLTQYQKVTIVKAIRCPYSQMRIV
jgi:hypothetical protein